MDRVAKEIDKLDSIEVNIEDFANFYKDSAKLKMLFEKSYEKALQKTDRTTFQAMEAFVHNLNTMHSRAGAQVPFSSINFGTDTSAEGRMVIKNYLLSSFRFYNALIDSTGFFFAARLTGKKVARIAVSSAPTTITTTESVPKLNTDAPIVGVICLFRI